MVSIDPAGFDKEVPSSECLIKQRTQVQHANAGTDRPKCRKNIKVKNSGLRKVDRRKSAMI